MHKINQKKAFIFDLDGVLINNEPIWEIAKREMFTNLFGKNIYLNLGSTVGSNIPAIHKKAVQLGSTIPLEKLFGSFQHHALTIYKTTPITEGVQELGQLLIQRNYAIGIVSASPKAWIDLVTSRLYFKDNISVIISLEERKDLRHKPAPDGYLEAIKKLGSTPASTFVLEDSNPGIASAKAAGAYVIGLKQNLVQSYVQEGADIYVDKVKDVEEIINKD